MLTGVRTARSHGFALPTILIASIVMMIVLLVSVSSGASVRNAILNQYYTQLAQVAGEAGVEYAKACLAQNGGVPQWSDANPLKPNTNCSGSPVVACPTTAADSRCAVSIDDNVRSSFSVGMPTLDADGKASLIPQTGYVEVLRTSNNAVWRTYRQPSAQAAVVPDLCSGRATSQLGWTNATSRTSSFGPTPATPISTSTTNINPGPMYFRKDFSIPKGGNFYFDVYANDVAEVYIDGNFLTRYDRAASGTSTVRTPTSLSVGCHSIVVKLTNTEVLVNSSVLVAMLIKQGSSAPTVVTDSTWRVTAGPQRHYSEPGYFADPNKWVPIRVLGRVSEVEGGTFAAGWVASGDPETSYISTNHSYDASNNYPSNQFTLFRDSRVSEVDSGAMEVKITAVCDDACYPYMDGTLLNTGIPLSAGVVSFTISVSQGQHNFGLLVQNGTGRAGYAFTAVDQASGQVISHTDDSWQSLDFWTATNPTGNYSYDDNYTINPDPIPVAPAQVLVVGGGGSGGGSTGGGGGAGGFIETTSNIEVGSYPVVVGAGGAIPGNQGRGKNGEPSSFNGIVALGGGAGGWSQSGAVGTARSGGSGGGGNGYGGATLSGKAIYGQGYNGGPTGNQSGAGGGGAGGTGTITSTQYVGGGGGPGKASSITGSTVYYAGGGAGGCNACVSPGGIGGGGNGGEIGASGAANTGGGGGGGWSYASGNGGAGGSGVVIIRYVTGSIVATGGAISYSGDFTIHRFTSSGTFNVTKVNDPTQANVARGTTLISGYSNFSLSSGATYSSSAGRITTNAGYALSPLVLVNRPTSIIIGGDFYATTASPYASYAPDGAFQVSVKYYAADGVTPVLNSAGYDTNGCSRSFALNVWDVNDQRCSFSGGPNVVYLRYYIYGSAQGRSSPDLTTRNPLVITN